MKALHMVGKSHSVIVIAAAFAAFTASPQRGNAQRTEPSNAQNNLDTLQQYLEPVIRSSNLAVRLYYRANCFKAKELSGAYDPVPFPRTKVQPALKSKTGIAAVREIFARDKNVTVSQGSNGIIRIWVGKVPTSILETKLRLLKLDSTAQYNPNQAFIELENTKELDGAVSSLGVWPVGNLSSTRATAMPGLPHLPNVIRNMTADQFLDEIAKTWAGEGFVVYGACTRATGPNGEKWFWLDYAGSIFPR